MAEYTADYYIKLLNLVPHPEGGLYALSGTSGFELPEIAGIAGRESCSCIYYMIRKGEISRWHRLKSPEVWTWHAGGSLVTTLGGTGDMPKPQKEMGLGPRLEAGERFLRTVPAGNWQTSRVVDGDFVLVSCIVSPSYSDEDCLLPQKPLDCEIYE